MRHLYDFGISQEDPITEFKALEVKEGDHILCVGSGGEVPLSLLSLKPEVKITAIDISENQLRLCRLKLQAAISLEFPLNGEFLGYSQLNTNSRRKIYYDRIHDNLNKVDQEFWSSNLSAVENGVINYGRFERYIKLLRGILVKIIGKKNLLKLISCKDNKDQKVIFDQLIGRRIALKYLFRLAFHPMIYRKRGLSSKALIHANTSIGEVFFYKFRDFCIATSAKKNYFLQYFLLGTCIYNEAFPEYLQKNNRSTLIKNSHSINFKKLSIQEELVISPVDTYSKIHLSNIGDWISEEEFNYLLDQLNNAFTKKGMMCYRFLQKNHFENNLLYKDSLDVTELNVERTDRFPFYNVLSISYNG